MSITGTRSVGSIIGGEERTVATAGWEQRTISWRNMAAEALQSAIKMLKEQTGDGKVVGIISHVDALRDAIQSKVVVRKGQEGSTLRVEP